MGGRGANYIQNGHGSTFRSEKDFEKSLKGVNDPRLKEYDDALEQESHYNRGLEKNFGRAIDEDGYTDAVSSAIAMELKDTQKALDAMPNNKTPAQLGRMEALKERISILHSLQGRKGEKGNGRGNVNII